MYMFLHPVYNCYSAEHSNSIKERAEWEKYSLHKIPLQDVSKFDTMSGVPVTSAELVIHWEDSQESASLCFTAMIITAKQYKPKSAKGKAIEAMSRGN